MSERNSAMINGALIAVGALGIFDNIVFHWILQLHRAVPGPHALAIEIVLVIASIGLLMVGAWRESRKEVVPVGLLPGMLLVLLAQPVPGYAPRLVDRQRYEHEQHP